MMDTITLSVEDMKKPHSYLKDFQPRVYQENIFNTCTKSHTLVVLPTGVGKTAIFLMMAAYRLKMYPNSKILLLGPTRPLIEQYFEVFTKHFDIEKEKLAIFTGFVSPEKRVELWKNAQIIFSTPQGLENDIMGNKIDLKNVSLIGFDEAHRATGEYSYNFVAKQYLKHALYPRILALTASPGTDKETITEVCANLSIEKIEVRSAKDEDVAPYVKEVDVQRVYVELPDIFLEVKKHFKTGFDSKLKELKALGVTTDNIRYSKSQLLKLQASLHAKIADQGQEKDFDVYKSLSISSELMKFQYAIELLETQGLGPLREYIAKVQLEAQTGKTKASQNIVKDFNFRTACSLLNTITEDFEHPKFTELKVIVQKELDPIDPLNKEKKIIIFSQYRDAGQKITKELNKLGITAKLFVGQAKKKDTGLSQKKQKEMLDEFSNSKFNVLVSSSVGEEGLDIPQVDLVIFYEPVPSAIRKIQRSGRTGRLEDGRIIMLITKDTIDEVYYHVSKNKEKRMYSVINEVTRDFKKQSLQSSPEPIKSSTIKTLHDYEAKTEDAGNDLEQIHKIKIVTDYREKGSLVMKSLLNANVVLELQKLDIGDFLLSQRVIIEYKTTKDFVDSIIDGRLLKQLPNLKKYEKPLVIIEGEDLYAQRNIHPNAIRGMLTTIAISYGIPILTTKKSQETADLLMSIAKKEQFEQQTDFTMHNQKPQTIKDQQEYLISALPNIGPIGAKPLLKEFKSIKNIITASEKDLQSVELIGPKKSKQLFDLFNVEWKE